MMPPDIKPLKILVFGAGAIGTYIGGSLALRGHQAVFLERPQVAAELEKRGLRLKLGDGEHHIQQPVITPVIERALAHGPFDVGIFALKSFDTGTILESLSSYHADLPSILCLGNGVENETAIAEVLGPERVIAGTVTSAIGRRSAGDIVLERLRGVGIANTHPIAVPLAEAMTEAGLVARLYPRPADMKWSKMLTNLLANASSAILDMPPAEIFADPALARLEIRQLSETLAVMRAQKIRVVDLPGTPVRLLALGVRLPAALSYRLMGRAVGGGRGGKMPSFHIDLHSGRGKSEVEYLNGAVARFGEEHGVPTPVNHTLNRILMGLTNGEIPLEHFAHHPEKLLAAI